MIYKFESYDENDNARIEISITKDNGLHFSSMFYDDNQQMRISITNEDAKELLKALSDKLDKNVS